MSTSESTIEAPRRAQAKLWTPDSVSTDIAPPQPAPAGPPKRSSAPAGPSKKSSAKPVRAAVLPPADDAEEIDGPRYTRTMKELPARERPRERLEHAGAWALSAPELLAILIGSGVKGKNAVSVAENLLAHFGGLRALGSATVGQIAEVEGLGKATAAAILAAVELGNRMSVPLDEDRPVITGPEDVYNLLRGELRDLKKETLKSLLLDAKNRVCAIRTVSIGDLTSSIANPREIFKDAVTASAASIIVAHNHPSGDPTPSADDLDVTCRLEEAGKILGIELLDHVVIGDGRYVSLKDLGLF
jgi:DNA repair protein RadC